MNQNIKAFLDMIAISEGTKGRGDDGYNVIVGGALFHNHYVDHPRILVKPPKIPVASTAAGRYQILARYWDAYRALLQLPDFSPASQDAFAINYFKECKAIDDIKAGEFEAAVKKCASRWASLPGAGYGQRENKLELLRGSYMAAGGSVA